MIENLSLFLLSTIFVSLSGVMMPGPVFAVTVTKGYRDRMAGALIAFGHGLVEFPLMALIGFGFARFFSSNLVKMVIGLLGGFMLIYMGFDMFRARGKTIEGSGNQKHGSIAAGIITTGANPYFFLWWATIGVALIMNANIFGIMGILLFAVTHWMCDFFWDLFVSMTVFKSRHLWTKRVHKMVFCLCAVVLIGFGAWFIVSVF